MGTAIKSRQPCLDQTTCKSSDALVYYDDGGAHCFSCGKNFNMPKEKFKMGSTASEPEKKEINKALYEKEIAEIKTYSSRGFQERGIPKNVCEFFDVKVAYNDKGEISDHYYPYSGGGYKHRQLPKTFHWVGPSGGLFGKNKFTGGGKRLIITEGEIDALSVAYATMAHYKREEPYPVVSISSATGTKDLLNNRDWIRSFQEVVLCLDNDKAGDEATQKAIKIIGLDKVKVWKPPLKDANEILLKYGVDRINRCIWDAESYTPAGIINKEELWQALSTLNDKVSVPYPRCLDGLNRKLKGMREGEIVLFTSGSGSGKSTIMREIMLCVLSTTPKDIKIGVVSLEESPAETARKLSGMAIARNPAIEEIPIEDIKKGFDIVFGDDRVILLDHQGSIKDNTIMEQLEYMCLMGCKYIFLDHITILVSEGSEGLQGNEAIDKVMGDLLRLVKKHPVWIGLVSHLRKVQTGSKSFESGKLPSIDDIKGSGSIKQISFDIIAFARDMTAENEDIRNSIMMSVLKCRHTGLTGPIPGARYDINSGRLYALDVAPSNAFTEVS